VQKRSPGYDGNPKAMSHVLDNLFRNPGNLIFAVWIAAIGVSAGFTYLRLSANRYALGLRTGLPRALLNTKVCFSLAALSGMVAIVVSYWL
jgi:hypothetical protein